MSVKHIQLTRGLVYPGTGYHYVLCDVCGIKLRAKDAVLVKDKYNYQNNLLVCPEDRDKTNPQSYLKARQEKQLENVKFVRGETEDRFVFIDSPSEIEGGDTSNPTGRAPQDVPVNVKATADSSTSVELNWRYTGDPGSDPISGYKIERESPEGGGFSTIVADTGFPSLRYVDTGLSANTEYNYRLSAINRVGTGSASDTDKTTTSAS